MFSLEELAALFAAVGDNTVSLFGGILGIVFTIISIFLPNSSQRRALLVIGLICLMLAPIYAWRDEYREHGANQVVYRKAREAWQKGKENAERSFQDQLNAKNQELRNKESENVMLKDIRKNQQIALKPNVSLSFRHNSADGAGWRMVNNGLGPAIIQWFSVTIDGQPYSDWRSFGSVFGISDYLFNIPGPGTQFGANASINLFFVKPSPHFETLIKNYSRVEMDLCYCSLFDQCWLTTNKYTRPTKSDSCKKKPDVYFRG